MSRSTGELVLAAVFAGLGVLFLVLINRKTIRGSPVGPFVFLLLAAVAAGNTFIQKDGARVDHGELQQALLLGGANGNDHPVLVVVTRVELSDPLSWLSRGGSSAWWMDRIIVFDPATGKRQGLLLFEDERMKVLGQIQGSLLVSGDDKGTRLIGLDGKPGPDLDSLVPDLRSRDPRLSAITHVAFNRDSGCLVAKAPDAYFLLDLATLTVTTGDFCDRASNERQQIKLGNRTLGFIPVERALPAGAHSTQTLMQLGWIEQHTQLGPADGLEEPSFVVDPRSGKVNRHADDQLKSVVVLHRAQGQYTLSEFDLAGAELWRTPLSNSPDMVASWEGNPPSLLVLQNGSHLLVLDPANGTKRGEYNLLDR